MRTAACLVRWNMIFLLAAILIAGMPSPAAAQYRAPLGPTLQHAQAPPVPWTLPTSGDDYSALCAQPPYARAIGGAIAGALLALLAQPVLFAASGGAHKSTRKDVLIGAGIGAALAPIFPRCPRADSRHDFGNAKATYVPPEGASFLPPPHAMTMYWRPSTM